MYSNHDNAPVKSRRALDWASLTNGRISRNRRNLQNRNSAASEISIRFGPKILLKCDRRKTGPKYPTIRIGSTTGTNLRSHSITSSIITTGAFPRTTGAPAHVSFQNSRHEQPAAACCMLCCAAADQVDQAGVLRRNRPVTRTVPVRRCGCGSLPAPSSSSLLW
jgi:hypothetical protein